MCIYNPRISPRMNWSVIGLFGRVINNNVELCSDWLFQSAAQCWALLWLAVSQCGSFQLISHTAGRKHREENIYFNTFSRQVIILYIKWKCGHQGAAIICGALKLLSNARSLFTFTFKIHDRMNSVYTMERQYLPHILQDQMLVSGVQDL